jgi:hypothetical protein
MMLETIHVDAPASWASALINRDFSGLDPETAAHVLQWLSVQGNGQPVSCNPVPFTWRWKGIQCELLTYAFLVNPAVQERKRQLRQFRDGYIEAIFFTEGGPDNDEVQAADLSEASELAIAADCAAFISANQAILDEATSRVGYDWGRAGQDFWFTRNGHGVGYWDRRELEDGDLGRKLTDVSQHHEVSEVCVGDDGALHYRSNWPDQAKADDPT